VSGRPEVVALTPGLTVAVGAAAAVLVLVGFRQGSGLVMALGCGLLATILLSRLFRPPLESLSFCFRGPERVVAGQLVRHRLHAHNRGRRPCPPVRVLHHMDGFADTVLSVPALPAGGRAEVEVWRTAESRGIGTVHILRVSCGAPFGMLRWRLEGRVRCRVVVHPRPGAPVPVESIGTDGDRPTGGPDRCGGGVHGVREYRPGDAVHQVHWRASARHGRLVVVEPERTLTRRISLLVVGIPIRSGPVALWEDAVSVAAWTVADLVGTGGTARLYAVQAGLASLTTDDPSSALDWFAALDEVVLPDLTTLEALLGTVPAGDLVSVVATPAVPAGWWDMAGQVAGRTRHRLVPFGVGPTRTVPAR
jgi:uncharacterized protein (DUF58 family)